MYLLLVILSLLYHGHTNCYDNKTNITTLLHCLCTILVLSSAIFRRFSAHHPVQSILVWSQLGKPLSKIRFPVALLSFFSVSEQLDQILDTGHILSCVVPNYEFSKFAPVTTSDILLVFCCSPSSFRYILKQQKIKIAQFFNSF